MARKEFIECDGCGKTQDVHHGRHHPVHHHPEPPPVTQPQPGELATAFVERTHRVFHEWQQKRSEHRPAPWITVGLTDHHGFEALLYCSPACLLEHAGRDLARMRSTAEAPMGVAVGPFGPAN